MMDDQLAQRLLTGQLAMHAVNDPARIATLAANAGVQPPQMPAPTPIQQPIEKPAAVAPAAGASSLGAQATQTAKSDIGPRAGEPMPAPAAAAKPTDWSGKLGKAAAVLGAVAPPSQPNPPPEMHAPAPQGGAGYNPAVVAAFIAALQQGQGGQQTQVPSLGALIGG